MWEVLGMVWGWGWTGKWRVGNVSGGRQSMRERQVFVFQG